MFWRKIQKPKPMLKHITYFSKLCVQGKGIQTAWRDSIKVFHLFNKAVNSQANLFFIYVLNLILCLMRCYLIQVCSWLICAQLMILGKFISTIAPF